MHQATDKRYANPRAPLLHEDYCQMFIDTGMDRYKWSKERIGFPRTRKSIYAINTEEDFKRGHRVIKVPVTEKFLEDYKNKYNKEYPRLDKKRDLAVKLNPYTRQKISNAFFNKYEWVFIPYDYEEHHMLFERKYKFFAFDLDFHPKEHNIKEIECLLNYRVDENRHYTFDSDYEEAKDKFEEQIQKVKNFLNHYNINGIWYNSPGNAFHVLSDERDEKGRYVEHWEHIQGRYCIVFMRESESLNILQSWFAFYKDVFGITCEMMPIPQKNFRLPGQCYMEVYDKEGNIIPELILEGKDNYYHFMDSYSDIKENNFSDLSNMRSDFTKWLLAGGSLDKGKTSTIPSDWFDANREISFSSEQIASLKGEADTFKAATQYAKIFCKLNLQIHHGKITKEQALNKAVQLMKEIRPEDSGTCSNEKILNNFCARELKYYFDTYDESKDREAQDIKRFEYCRKYSFKDIVNHLQDRGVYLSKRYEECFKTFWNYCLQKNGRVAAKKIYWTKDCLMSKAHWFVLKKKLNNFIVILKNFDKNSRKCTQWGLAPSFLSAIQRKKDTCKQILSWTSQGGISNSICREGTSRGEVILGIGLSRFGTSLLDANNEKVEPKIQ